MSNTQSQETNNFINRKPPKIHNKLIFSCTRGDVDLGSLFLDCIFIEKVTGNQRLFIDPKVVQNKTD